MDNWEAHMVGGEEVHSSNSKAQWLGVDSFWHTIIDAILGAIGIVDTNATVATWPICGEYDLGCMDPMQLKHVQ